MQACGGCCWESGAAFPLWLLLPAVGSLAERSSPVAVLVLPVALPCSKTFSGSPLPSGGILAGCTGCDSAHLCSLLCPGTPCLSGCSQGSSFPRRDPSVAFNLLASFPSCVFNRLIPRHPSRTGLGTSLLLEVPTALLLYMDGHTFLWAQGIQFSPQQSRLSSPPPFLHHLVSGHLTMSYSH